MADSARCILPAATLTNVGVSANARTMAHAIAKLLSDSLEETQDLGELLKAHAAEAAPTLVKYAEYNEHLARENAVGPDDIGADGTAGDAILQLWDGRGARQVLEAMEFRNRASDAGADRPAGELSEAAAAQVIGNTLKAGGSTIRSRVRWRRRHTEPSLHSTTAGCASSDGTACSLRSASRCESPQESTARHCSRPAERRTC